MEVVVVVVDLTDLDTGAEREWKSNEDENTGEKSQNEGADAGIIGIS